MILLIDNYDSFTYNLYQYLGELGEEVNVVRNDAITIEEISQLNPSAIILSPGPGRPENAGITVELIKAFYEKIPILGICLGHQAIGYAFGGKIVRAKQIMHGKISSIIHSGYDLFQYFSIPLEVMRYHSLIIDKTQFPESLYIMAHSMDDQEIMAVKHKKYPVYGFQFHPESIGTEQGKQLLFSFLQETRRTFGNENIIAKTVRTNLAYDG